MINTIKVQKEIILNVPRVPNFILTDDDSIKYSISDFTDEELRMIGKSWTVNLLNRANEIRLGLPE